MSDVPWRSRPRKPHKPRDPAVTSRMMSRVRSKDSKAELALRRELWSRGLRYRIHLKRLQGKPDLVFTGARVAVFVDSDFWHARSLVEGDESTFRAIVREKAWWVAKLTRNAERDREVTAALQEDGWRVVRIWETDLLHDPQAAADRVEEAMEAEEE